MLTSLAAVLALARFAAADMQAVEDSLPPSNCSWSSYRLPTDVIPYQYDMNMDVESVTEQVDGSAVIHIEIIVETDCVVLHSDMSITLGDISLQTAGGEELEGAAQSHEPAAVHKPVEVVHVRRSIGRCGRMQ